MQDHSGAAYQKWEEKMEQAMETAASAAETKAEGSEAEGSEAEGSEAEGSGGGGGGSGGGGRQLKLVVLELGCGVNVPSVRRESEEVLEDVLARVQQARTLAKEQQAGSDCNSSAEEERPEESLPSHQASSGDDCAVMIRINPDYPLNPRDQAHTISIRQGALAAMQRIQAEVDALDGTA
jgi:hypothetical protein